MAACHSGALCSFVGSPAMYLVMAGQLLVISRVYYPSAMAETDAERFRKEAEDCRVLAEKASSPIDKEWWLRLAAEWLKLAQEAESRGGRWFRT
jgi:hypothetical protein